MIHIHELSKHELRICTLRRFKCDRILYAKLSAYYLLLTKCVLVSHCPIYFSGIPELQHQPPLHLGTRDTGHSYSFHHHFQEYFCCMLHTWGASPSDYISVYGNFHLSAYFSSCSSLSNHHLPALTYHGTSAYGGREDKDSQILGPGIRRHWLTWRFSSFTLGEKTHGTH